MKDNRLPGYVVEILKGIPFQGWQYVKKGNSKIYQDVPNLTKVAIVRVAEPGKQVEYLMSLDDLVTGETEEFKGPEVQNLYAHLESKRTGDGMCSPPPREEKFSLIEGSLLERFLNDLSRYYNTAN